MRPWPSPNGPLGAKGISEVATVPVTPAIINAIYDAVGVRITDLPATKERVLEGLKKRNGIPGRGWITPPILTGTVRISSVTAASGISTAVTPLASLPASRLAARLLLQGTLDLLRRYGKIPYPDANRIVNGVADRRRNGRD